MWVYLHLALRLQIATNLIAIPLSFPSKHVGEPLAVAEKAKRERPSIVPVFGLSALGYWKEKDNNS